MQGIRPRLFDGTNEEIFVPYFERDGEGSGNHPADGVSDAFRPPMPILYFRAEPTEEPMFDAADNPLDPTGREGFANQEHFEMLARRAEEKEKASCDDIVNFKY